jgi:RNA polymerase sigma factor (sigma-70 family)
MASTETTAVGQDLQRLFDGGAASGLSEAQLLDRVARRDEVAGPAFEAILRQHGPAVLSCCRRVLGDSIAAEDAFQATFLVLFRRAGSIRVGESVAPWLLHVARRAALKAREAELRRHARERRVARPEAMAPEVMESDLRLLVRAEVDRLPAKYRDPVCLCYFEGRTHDDAATVLGWPVGSVRGRLSRARDMLRQRLMRRGVGITPVALAAALTSGSEARAGVPRPLCESTLAATSRGAMVMAEIAALVAAVARGLIAATAVKVAAVALLVVSLVAAGAGLIALAGGSGRQPASKVPAAAQSAPARSGRTLELRVLNARTDRPEPGVTVRARIPARAEGQTDADGRLRIAGTEREFTVVFIGLSKPGFVPVQVIWDNASARAAVPVPREHTLRLEPASTIGGTIRDEQDQPIAGAEVRLAIPVSGNPKPGEPQVDLNNFRTQTDAEGRWKCDLVPARLELLSITVEHPDYVVEHNPFSRRTESPQTFADLEAGRAMLVLKEGLTLEGRVIDRDGRPIAGARVSPVFPNRSAATTDDRGRFELAHIATGPIELTVQARGYVPAQRKVAAGEAAPVEIRLEAGRAVTGRLVDQANRPIAGAFLQDELGPSNRAIGSTAHTDRDGRFRIEGVPFEGGNLVIRQGMNLTTQRVPPSGKDEDLALTLKTSQVRLRITATDADSKQPIPSFTVVQRGYMTGRQPATDGRFEMTMNRLPSRPGFPALQVLIEAEGYFPSESRRVPTDRDEIDLAFALKRGAAIAGIVRAPDGSPTDGAALALRKHSERITFDGTGLRNTGVYPIFETDRDGRFSIPPEEGRLELVAAHPLGFAFHPVDSAAGRPETTLAIKLRPWGRVEGVLKVGGDPAARQGISLRAPFRSEISRLEVDWYATTTTDDQGHFVFERVLPGLITPERTLQINPQLGLLAQPVPAMEVEPGATARVTIGGSGRPVVGRITIPGELKARWGSLQPYGRISVNDRPPRPDEQLTAEEKVRFDREWQKDHRSHAFLIQPDGSFRVEDIIPGEYHLSVQIHDDYEEPQFHGFIVLGKTERTITVPGLAGGQTRTDEPLDLGLIPFELDRGPAVGQVAPEVVARTLDGQPIKLSDFRGKSVLLVFWQSETVLDRADALALKAVASGLGRNDRLVMLGLNADTQGDEAAARAARHGWTWPQAKLGDPVGWEVRQKFAAYQLPSIWLIGPDGRVVARDLRGAAIKEAVAALP